MAAASACASGFAGISVNPQERFQYVGAESLVATISPHHPALQKPGQALYLEELVNVRQILVASCDLPLADTRPLIAGACWRTDSLGTALEMVEAGIGWAIPVVPGRPAAGNGKAGTPGLQEYQERAETACPRYLAEKPAIAQGRPGTGWHAGHPSRLKRYGMHFTEKTRPVTRIAAHAGSPASST